MTIRVLMTADAVGGVWQYAVDLARALVPHDVETLIANMGPSPSAGQIRQLEGAGGVRLIDTGLPPDWLAGGPEAIEAAGKAIVALAAKHRADIVHLNTPALAADARFPMPVLAVTHSCVGTWWATMRGGEPPEDFRWRMAKVEAGMRAADRVLAPSASFAEAVERTFNVSPDVVYNGRAPIRLRQRPMHDFAFTVGRLWDEAKNLRVLDQAAARLAVPMVAAGATTGPNGARVALDNMRLLGAVDQEEIARWLAARPVFVSAARYEPFGLAVLEAASAGCPLVLSDIPTFRELWDGCALFVDPDDHEGFAAAIDSIVGDPAERISRGQCARKRAREFTPAAMASTMAGIYAELTGRSLSPRRRVTAAAPAQVAAA